MHKTLSFKAQNYYDYPQYTFSSEQGFFLAPRFLCYYVIQYEILCYYCVQNETDKTLFIIDIFTVLFYNFLYKINDKKGFKNELEFSI